MKPLPHRYHVDLAAGPTGYAEVSVPGLPELKAAPPAEFDGPGDAWSPEHLLLAAVETCFTFTLRAVARASRLPLVAVEMGGEAALDRADGVTRFTEIVLRPRVVLGPGAEQARARRAIEQTERACLVTASLNIRVRVEPEIVGG